MAVCLFLRKESLEFASFVRFSPLNRLSSSLPHENKYAIVFCPSLNLADNDTLLHRIHLFEMRFDGGDKLLGKGQLFSGVRVREELTQTSLDRPDLA